MASFSAFDDAPIPNGDNNGYGQSDPFGGGSEDPAAAFLAQQQNRLADLDLDDGVPGANGNGNGQDDFGETPASAEEKSSEFVNDHVNDVNEFDPAPVTFNEPLVSENEVPENGDGFGGNSHGGSASLLEGFVVLDGADAADISAQTTVHRGFGTPDPDQQGSPYDAVAREDKTAREPEKIKRWREQFSARVTEKDAAEEQKRKQLRDQAAKELSDWERHYAEQIERQKSANRETEKAFIKQRDETTPGSEWERVCWLCDFNPKTSKQVKDVSRMRSLLLQLKQGGNNQVS